MNLSGALMGAANASQGYLEGQQTAIDNRLRNQLNALNVQNTEDQLAQQKQQRQSQAAIIDAMMMTSAGQPPSLRAGQPQPQQPQENPEQVLDTQSQALDRGMQAALATGNMDAYSKLLNTYTGIQTQLTNMQDKQSAMQLSGLKAKEQEYNIVARNFQGVTDQASWDKAMHDTLNDPSIPQESKANLSQMSYSPGRVHLIVSRGLSAAESTRAQIQAQQHAETQRHNQQIEQETKRKDNFSMAAKVAELQNKTNANKSGAKISTPTSNDLTLASTYIKQNLGLTGDQSGNENYKLAVNTVATIAKQLMARNPAYSYPSALAMAVHMAKVNGQLNIQDTPEQSKTFLGIPYGKTPEQKTIESANTKGTLPSQPLPLPHGASAEDLMPGTWYQYVKDGKTKVGQWDGTKFIPLNSAVAQ